MKLHIESIEVPSYNDPNKEKVLDRVATFIRKALDSSMRVQIDMKRSDPNANEETSTVNLIAGTRMLANSSHESLMKTVDFFLTSRFSKESPTTEGPFAVRVRWSETTGLPDTSEKLFVIDLLADKTMDKKDILSFYNWFPDHVNGYNSTTMMGLRLALDDEEAIMRDGVTLTELC
jgi:hypothetical protein